MFDRIKFTNKGKSVVVTADPFFVDDYIVYHEVKDEIRILEKDMKGFETKEPLCIFDAVKNIQYDINESDYGLEITVEEMSLDTLLKIGLSREALDQIILLQKKITNPR
ncbi:hypothetical protein HUU42_13000 [bacterium]|nr:hypothetical protein [bacterium]